MKRLPFVALILSSVGFIMNVIVVYLTGKPSAIMWAIVCFICIFTNTYILRRGI